MSRLALKRDSFLIHYLCLLLSQSTLDSSPRNPSPVVQNGEKGELAVPALLFLSEADCWSSLMS